MTRSGLLVSLLTVLLTVTACAGNDGDGAADAAIESAAPSDQTTPSTTTTSPEPVGDETTRYNLEVGDCFNVYNAQSLITRVPCDQPHDREVFHHEQHPAPHGEPFPGEREMRQYALQVCYRQFQPFVGGLYEVSSLEIGAFTPDQENFEDARARYRGITCWLRGKEPLTGSARGSGL